MRLLVIKPDHLGDLLLATPALSELRRRLPDAQITGLVGPWAAAVWRANPDLDALLTLPFPGFARQARPSGTTRLAPYWALVRYAALLHRRFDAALILRDDHWWGAWLAAAAAIPTRIGFDHPRSRPFLTMRLPLDQRQHVSRQALDLVATLAPAAQPTALPIGQPPLRFVLDPADQAWAAQVSLGADRLVVLQPGTGGPTKHWPIAHWRALAAQLAADRSLTLVLNGGPEEEALTNAIASATDPPLRNFTGQLALGQSVALLARAALVIGSDSGPLHLAVSQAVPTLHLFGPSDARRFGPWGDSNRHRVIRVGIGCSPCGVFAACPRGLAEPECMHQISIEHVYHAAQTLLQRF